MWGAIIGDVVGSRFEWVNTKHKDFNLFANECLFTDDTVLTVAVAKTLLECSAKMEELEFKNKLIYNFKFFTQKYLDRGYGSNFISWAASQSSQPYNSCGNGSAMRVSPVAWYAQTLVGAETLAKWSAEVTHNHPDGIKGAATIAGAIFLAKTGADKEQIIQYVSDKGYDMDLSVDEYAAAREFDVTCQGTIPRALQCFLEGADFEDVIRNAVFIGGDTDTNAAIAGSVAEAHFGIDQYYKSVTRRYLNDDLLTVVDQFTDKYCCKK